MRLQAPRGTLDVLPGDARRRLDLQRSAADVLGRAGYEPFETPIFEDTELFARGVGEATDIVQKEMFTFEDKAGRSLTLRPEGTAGVCRAYAEHGMHKLAQPVKLWYWGPFFRHEAPQAGRFRQFTQVGAEALGSDDPSLDAELILLLAELIERAGAGPARLRVSSLGTPETRAAYLEELTAYLRAREGELSEEVRERLDQNPLRAFDADHPGTQAVMEEAPRLLDRLDPADAEHFTEVRALLDNVGMQYDVDSTLVRGLDYYTRTVFEFESERLGAQAALGGGGRYDRLVEELGGPATPGVGWAAGIERILLAAQEAPDSRLADVFVAIAKPESGGTAFLMTQRLRREGLRVVMEQAGRGMKGQLRQANRVGARATVIVGDSMDVKEMDSGEQREATSEEDVVELVGRALARDAAADDAVAEDATAEDAPA
jgi:histidyl-tRNA synthetase